VDLSKLHRELLRSPESLGVVSDFWSLRPRFKIHWLPHTDSTNRTLVGMVANGADPGTVVIASRQTAGRGQWGRPWQSPAGGLYLSLALAPAVALERSSYFTLASSWGLATSLINLGIPAQVKWPNDIIVRGKKLGGVLAEARTSGSLLGTLIVGLGLNCFNSVPPTGVSLEQVMNREHPQKVLESLEGIAAVALYGLLQGYFFWQTRGDRLFIEAYQSIMAHVGQTLIVNGRQARVIGVSAAGNLQLQADDFSEEDQHSLEFEPGKVTLGYNT